MAKDRFRKFSEELFETDLDVPTLIEQEDDFDLIKLVKKSIDPITGIPRNMKLPEGDFKEAKNYFDFVSNYLGHDAKFPFARQLWLAVTLLGEVCPRCTDKKFLKIDTVPVDYPAKHLPDRMQFLHYGKCPKCHTTKAELLKNKEINLYTEMALCVGQRGGKCVSGDTKILTEKGLVSIESLNDNYDYGFSKYKGPKLVLENGELVKPSHFYIEKPENLLEITLNNGMSIKGTANHPLWTLYGWKNLDSLNEGDLIPLKIGQDTWAKDFINLDKLVDVAEDKFESKTLDSVANRPCYDVGLKTTVLSEELAGVMALYIAEGYSHTGYGFSITNYDKSIIQYIEKALTNSFYGIRFSYTKNKSCIRVPNKKLSTYFDLLLGTQLAKRSAGKFIPESIFRSPKKVVASFLRMLFEGDGCMNGSKINYTSLSKTLVKDIQILLNNFGITSELKETTGFASNGSAAQIRKPVFNLFITGHESKKRFRDEINFFSKRKIECLDKSIKKTTYTSQPNKSTKLPEEIQAIWIETVLELKDYLRNVESFDAKGRSFCLGINSVFTGKKIFRKNLGINRRFIIDNILIVSKWYPRLPKELVEKFEVLNRLAKDYSIYFSRVSKIEKTPKEVTYDFNVPKYHRFLGNGFINHNSTITASIVSYIIHKYLKFPKLSSVCDGIAGSTPLTGTFVGGRTSDAIALLWEPITNIISDSPWFTNFHEMLTDRGNHYGVEFFRQKDLYLKYSHRNLEFYPSGPTKRGLRGRTRIIAATDEIGWFPSLEDAKDRERADAPEVYEALDKSLLTVRKEVRSLVAKGYNNFIPGLAINISSPSSQTDMISKLVNENQNSNRVLAVRLATWNISPLYKRDNEEIEEAYRRNAVTAERDYGANPPLNASKFIDVEEDQILKCFKLNNSAQVEQQTKVINDRLRVAAKLSNVSKLATPRYSLISLDAGYTFNSFSITVITAEQQLLPNNVKSVLLRVPVVLEVVPPKGSSIHYKKIYTSVIKPLIETFNAKFLFADRWNSIALLDTAEEEFASQGLTSTIYSVKYDDFIITKSYLQEQKLLLPKLEMDFTDILKVENYPNGFIQKPMAHLLYQMMTVRDRGKTVIKGDNATDDIFRALVLGVSRALNDKVLPELLKTATGSVSGRLTGAVASGRVLGSSYVAGNNSTVLTNSSAVQKAPNSKVVVYLPRH